MAHQPDAFDMGDADDDDPDEENTGTCRRCGARVEFIHSGVRWRMYEHGTLKLHQCNPPIDAAEFQPIKE